MYCTPQIIDTASFEPSRMTVIEGSSGMVPQILFRLCAASAASGRILYKPGRCLLSGRLHLDASSFVFREGGLSGLIDLARITGIPVQELSRLSPGSAVTALQVNQALQDGVLVPWKRNLAEYWKTAEELLIADRGALVIEPKVGLHENVFEVDFASLFPNIMVNHNISPETVLCKCCPDSRKRVPFTHYNICERPHGACPAGACAPHKEAEDV